MAYYIIVGISERSWSDEWLEESNAAEDELKSFKGKEYTEYQARQKQRQMETAMRAQREKIQLLQVGGADPNDILLAKCKYQAQLDEYSTFSKFMGLKQERARIYVDGLGRKAPDYVPSYVTSDMLKNMTRDTTTYNKYKNILGNSAPSLEEFRKLKYNSVSEYAKLQRNYETFKEINSKNWTLEFKEKAKEAYYEFAEQGIEFSSHGIARYLDRAAKYVEVTTEKVIQINNQVFNYGQDNGKSVKYYDGLALIYAENSSEIVSIIKRNTVSPNWRMLDG